MRILSHNDADLGPLLPQISKHTKMAEMMKLPFWVFAEDSHPIGIVTVGSEPLQLLAPIGTPFAIVDLIRKDGPRSVLEEFSSQALKHALKEKAQYVTIELASEEKDAVDSFLEGGFRILADTFMMTLQLERVFDSPESLQLVVAQKEEMAEWIELARRFLSGSADAIMERMLGHLSDMPENLLEMYHSSEKFYFADEDTRRVGILNYSPTVGRISNIGIDPERRGQGYGRQTILFGLRQLRDAGCKQAKLRVHVDNKPALGLYRSLGFEVAAQRRFLIWEKNKA